MTSPKHVLVTGATGQQGGAVTMALMFEWFDAVGYSADIDGLRRDFPEVGWQRADGWVRSQDWEAILG